MNIYSPYYFVDCYNRAGVFCCIVCGIIPQFTSIILSLLLLISLHFLIIKQQLIIIAFYRNPRYRNNCIVWKDASKLHLNNGTQDTYISMMYCFNIRYNIVGCRRTIVESGSNVNCAHARIDLFHLRTVGGSVTSEMKRFDLNQNLNVEAIREKNNYILLNIFC